MSQSLPVSDDDTEHVDDVAYVSHDNSIGLLLTMIKYEIIRMNMMENDHSFAIDLVDN